MEIPKVVIIGGGPVGGLAALYAAKRGYQVEVYEFRKDCRLTSEEQGNFSKSLNLTLSTRGLEALEGACDAEVLQEIICGTAPVHSRMVHGVDSAGHHTETEARYDVHGNCLRVVDRGFINQRLLNALDCHSNISVFFEHKLLSCDFDKKQAVLEVKSSGEELPAPPESQPDGLVQGNVYHPVRQSLKRVDFDLLIGADGAHSITRQSISKQSRMNLQQQWVDVFWCELTISANGKDEQPLSQEHLHIWPGKEHMFMGLPNASKDNTFTCNLFGSQSLFQSLSSNPESIVPFFQKAFPGVVPNLIQPADLTKMIRENPHFPLLDIRCSPHNYRNTGVLVGDAANAMVPFYGQGLNTGLESVRILFEKFIDPSRLGGKDFLQPGLLDEFSAFRYPDVHAMNELALANYHDMRIGVKSWRTMARKRFEEALTSHLPALGWRTLYYRVAFTTERFSVAKSKSEWQQKAFERGCFSAMLLLVGFTALAVRMSDVGL